MNNKYILFRHGESKPNIDKLVCSDIKNGEKMENGLTVVGSKQVFQSIEDLKLSFKSFNSKIIIISSPFSRALQSASILKDGLEISHDCIQVDSRLSERYFGMYEGKQNSIYSEVWKQDETHTDFGDGVETPLQVHDRVGDLIIELENRFINTTIILVSHGDTIMIAKTWFKKNDPYFHHLSEYPKNAQFFIF
jgi:broad specificity phosphatase PhoE